MHAQPSREVVIELVTAKLREKCEDQAGFSKFLALLNKAARMQKPLQSLNGHVLDSGMLSECLQAVRQSCDFPIPPDPETNEMDPSPFQQAMDKIADNTAVSTVAPFTVVFLRLEPDTLSLLKAGHDPSLLTLNFMN